MLRPGDEVTLKVLFVIPTLGQGGAQKELVDLANDFAAQNREEDGLARHDVRIATFGSAKQTMLRQPSDCVEIVYFDLIQGKRTSLNSVVKGFSRLRQEVIATRPHVVVAFQDIANFPAIYACRGGKSAVIVAERQDLSFYRYARLRAILRRMFYRYADAIVVQTAMVKRQVEPELQNKTWLISNAVSEPGQVAKSAVSATAAFRIVSVGRLESQKNYPLLIEAAAHAFAQHEHWTLHIFGDGSLKESLDEQIRSAGMSGRIILEGLSTEIESELAKSHLFVMPSLYEGFPNALSEATAAGLPCIAYNDVSGVSDLIEDDFNGLTLGTEQRNASDLAHAMLGLMVDHKRRGIMGANGLSNVSRYSRYSVLQKWQAVLDDVLTPS